MHPKSLLLLGASLSGACEAFSGQKALTIEKSPSDPLFDEIYEDADDEDLFVNYTVFDVDSLKRTNTVSFQSTSFTSSDMKFLFPTDVGHEGHTRTAQLPFLAQTNGYLPLTEKLEGYKLPNPIETGSQGFDFNESQREPIQHFFGVISPFYQNDGFNASELKVPDQCSIKQVHLVSRHGSRYPISLENAKIFSKLKETKVKFINDLGFLNGWQYTQGIALLTNLGNQQLFDKGVNFFFRYGKLFDINNPNKLVARSTSQSRMKNSALYFLNGFFGLDWQDHVNLELVLEGHGFNNTLGPYCAHGKHKHVDPDHHKINKYIKQYLSSAVDRFNNNFENINGDNDSFSFDALDLFKLQELCTYETNTLGYSKFCSLFSYDEWENYEYVQDWTYYNKFLAPYNEKISKSYGMGWVEEFKSRLLGQPFNQSRFTTQNQTLVNSNIYFPLNQSLYFDFSHDTVMLQMLYSLGIGFGKNSFSESPKNMNENQFRLSKVVPFAAQIVFEIIECTGEVDAFSRQIFGSSGNNKTKYIHLLVNDNTIPLDEYIGQCGYRVDGWCDFDSFIGHLEKQWYTNGVEMTEVFEEVCMH